MRLFLFSLALRLGCTVRHLVAEMDPGEVRGWIAYLSITKDDLAPKANVEDQLRRVFGKPKDAK